MKTVGGGGDVKTGYVGVERANRDGVGVDRGLGCLRRL